MVREDRKHVIQSEDPGAVPVGKERRTNTSAQVLYQKGDF